MYKILVVDDEKMIRELIKRYAKFEGHEVVEACDGMEAIEKCHKEDYDLIIMDVMMPELDGCTTLDNLKTLDGFITPVVMMTASSKDEVQDKIDEHGFDGYLSKPINKEYLEELLNTLLNK